MITKFNSTNIPSKLNSLNNKVVVVDGIVGGGEGALISNYQRTTQS
jgi:hypothetical protein